MLLIGNTTSLFVRFFEAAGGVPQLCRTDRIGAIEQSQGRRFKLHPPTLEFVRHHGTGIKSCQAGDAKREGKIERPFRDLSESPWRSSSRSRCPPRPQRIEPSRTTLGRRTRPRPPASNDRCCANRTVCVRARIPVSVAGALVRHRLRRGPASASSVAVHRVGTSPLLSPGGLPRPTRRGQ